MAQRGELGRILIEAKLLTEDQLKMAVDLQESVGGKLGAIIVKLNFIEEGKLTSFIAQQQGLPLVNLDELVLPENLVRRIPRNLIEKHHVIPIRFHDGVLTVAVSDPFDYEALEEIQLAADCRIEMQLAARSQILRSVTDVFSREQPLVKSREKTKEDLLRELEKQEKGEGGGGTERDRLLTALVSLLDEKGVIKKDDVLRRARELREG